MRGRRRKGRASGRKVWGGDKNEENERERGDIAMAVVLFSRFKNSDLLTGLVLPRMYVLLVCFTFFGIRPLHLIHIGGAAGWHSTFTSYRGYILCI